MLVVLDQRHLFHKKTSPVHPKYGLHMLQNSGSVQFYRTMNTDLPKLCTAQLRRFHRKEYWRPTTGEHASESYFQFVYQHADGTLFADTFGDSQWGFPGATITDPQTMASVDLENFGTTFADEPTVFGTTMPTPNGVGRVCITDLLDKICK